MADNKKKNRTVGIRDAQRALWGFPVPCAILCDPVPCGKLWQRGKLCPVPSCCHVMLSNCGKLCQYDGMLCDPAVTVS